MVGVASMPPEIRARARVLAHSSYRAGIRIALDIAMWIGAAALAQWAGNIWITAAAIFFIGFVCIHDLLIQGHDGVHSMISRRRWINEPLTWLCHALAGCSFTAHRAFHLQHHRRTHGPHDPEFMLLRRIWGAKGTSYLVLPWLAPVSVVLYGLVRSTFPGVRWRTLRDLVLIAMLHGAIVAIAGWQRYALFMVAPGLTGLAVAFAVRSIFEHHGAVAGDPWRHARTLDTHLVVRVFWSNINHHLEHHLFPKVPVHRLPELRGLLSEEYARRGIVPAQGFAATATRLFGEAEHFGASEALGKR